VFLTRICYSVSVPARDFSRYINKRSDDAEQVPRIFHLLLLQNCQATTWRTSYGNSSLTAIPVDGAVFRNQGSVGSNEHLVQGHDNKRIGEGDTERVLYML
jgi:hypothetical protein